MDFFAGKTAIVTGAASGIGKAVSEVLAEKGAIVILSDINAGLLEETAASIRAKGYIVHSTVVDVTKFPDVQKMIDNVIAEHGRLDYLFNNAGVAVFAETRDHAYHDDWCGILDVNLYGPINGTAAAFPKMVEQGSGHIINTASLAGLMPVSALCSYTVSKHGVVGLSLVSRMEGADLGVKVSVVCPGLIQTPMYYSRVVKIDQEKLLGKAPAGMSPEKCARVILRGVKKNKPIIVVSMVAKIMWLLYRISPQMMLKLGTLFLRRSRKEFRIA